MTRTRTGPSPSDVADSTSDEETRAGPTNYEPEVTPRELTPSEIALGYVEEKRNDQDRAYYAIRREHGIVGGLVDGHPSLHRIRVLYASRDGRRSFTRMYKATDEFEWTDDAFAAVAHHQQRAGHLTAKRSIQAFRQLVYQLHGGGD